MNNILIDQQHLRSILHYDRLTGVFKWLKSRKGVKNGGIAGTKCDDEGRRTITIDGKGYLASHLAFLYVTGSLPPKGILVDHKDRNPANDSWNNLRLATYSQNNANRVVNRLLPKGVYTSGKKFRAQCSQKYLGTFATIDEASLAYQQFAKQIFGEFVQHD